MIGIFWRLAPSGVFVKRALKKVLGGLFSLQGWLEWDFLKNYVDCFLISGIP
jgi:hypothetical protein